MKSDEGSLLCLRLKVIPSDDGEVVARSRPIENVCLRLYLLELHGVLTLLDLVIRKTFEVRSQPETRGYPDEPFGRIILEPSNRVAEIHRELMVKVVITLANSTKRGDEVIARGVLVIKWLIPEPVGERVDTKSRLPGVN